jgi:hypothetical protein
LNATLLSPLFFLRKGKVHRSCASRTLECPWINKCARACQPHAASWYTPSRTGGPRAVPTLLPVSQPRCPTDTNHPPPHGRRKSPTRKRCLCLRLPSVRRNQSRRPPLRRHLPLPHLSTRPFDPPPSPLPPPAGPCPRFSALPRTQPPPTPRRPESSCLPARRGPAWCPPRRREGLRALVVCIGGIGR